MPGKAAWLLILPLLLAGCVTVAEKEALEALPMYGQPEQVRSDYLRREDAAFVRQTGYRYRGDLQRASREWSRQGFETLRLGDPDGAMRRFNQSWLLDADNYQAYWGFAQVLVLREQPAKALPHLQNALRLIDDPYQKPALLSDLGTVYSLRAERVGPDESAVLFDRANTRFAEAVALDDRFAPVWQRWARSLYRQGDYAGAWEKVELARQRGVGPFASDFIQKLSGRMPAPDRTTPD